MEVFKIFGFAMTVVVLILVLKKQNPENAVVLSISAGVAILLFAINAFVPVLAEIFEIISPAGINNVYIKTLLKALGISLICQFVCESCKDAGQNALGANVLFCGRISIVFLSVPLFGEVMDIVKTILSI